MSIGHESVLDKWGVARDDIPSHPLPEPLHSSAAGQFFPEAAQVAYQMWELSAMSRVEVRPSPFPA